MKKTRLCAARVSALIVWTALWSFSPASAGELEGDRLAKEGRFKEAAAQYAAEIKSGGESLPLVIKAAEAYDSAVWPARSLVYWEKAIKLAKSGSEQEETLRLKAAAAHKWVGFNFYTLDKNHDGAVAHLDAAIELAPNYIEPYMLKARIQRERGDLAAALTTYKTALSLNPESEEARWFVREAEGELAHGEEAFNLFLQGYKSRKNGDLEEALALFQKAAEVSPDFSEAHYWLARMKYESGAFAESAAEWKKTLELDPANKSAAWFLTMAEKKLSAAAATDSKTDGPTPGASEPGKQR